MTTLPEHLCGYAGIEDEIQIVREGDSIEIWSKDRFSQAREKPREAFPNLLKDSKYLRNQ